MEFKLTVQQFTIIPVPQCLRHSSVMHFMIFATIYNKSPNEIFATFYSKTARTKFVPYCTIKPIQRQLRHYTIKSRLRQWQHSTFQSIPEHLQYSNVNSLPRNFRYYTVYFKLAVRHLRHSTLNVKSRYTTLPSHVGIGGNERADRVRWFPALLPISAGEGQLFLVGENPMWRHRKVHLCCIRFMSFSSIYILFY